MLPYSKVTAGEAQAEASDGTTSAQATRLSAKTLNIACHPQHANLADLALLVTTVLHKQDEELLKKYAS